MLQYLTFGIFLVLPNSAVCQESIVGEWQVESLRYNGQPYPGDVSKCRAKFLNKSVFAPFRGLDRQNSVLLPLATAGLVSGERGPTVQWNHWLPMGTMILGYTVDPENKKIAFGEYQGTYQIAGDTLTIVYSHGRPVSGPSGKFDGQYIYVLKRVQNAGSK